VEIIAGKVTPTVLLGLVQVSVLFGLGVALFGLAIPGSVVGLAAVSTVMTLAFVAIGVALAAWLRSTQALNLTSNIAGFALAGLGGAFTPLGVLPGWARTIAPVTPTYWAMRGYQAVILHPGGLGAVLKPTLVLLAWAAAFTVAAAVRFRVDETKRFN
jgi:ABC-2 type transport system permease protein